MVPVDPRLKGRMLNVFGQPIDGKPAIEANTYYPIHRPPIPLKRQHSKQELFVTGITSS